MNLNNKTTTIKHQLFWVVLVLLHIVLMCGLYVQFGFNYGNEGAKYLEQAQEIINGTYDWHLNYNSFYLTYELYLAAFLVLKIPTYIIIICTYLISMWAYHRFYMMLQKTINDVVAKVWISCMLLSPMLQYWQFNLFSETFFISLSLIYISIAFKDESFLNFIKLILLTPLLCLSRPNAIFIISIIGMIYAFKYNYFGKKLNTFFAIIYVQVITVFVFFFLPLPFKDFTLQLTAGAVYCGFPTLPFPQLTEGKYTLCDVYTYLYHTYGFQTVLELFFKKISSFFVTSRPYYSSFHNMINNIHGICYVACILPFITWKKYNINQRYFLLSIATIVVVNALMVGIIYNEWSERHTIQIFPFIFVGFAMAFDYLYKKINQHVLM